MDQTEIQLRNRDLFVAQVGLNVISAAKRGKCDLYGTFKFHLSVIRGQANRHAETLEDARRALRDSHGKRDAKGQLVTAQIGNDPNATQVVLADPILFEKDERELLDQVITIAIGVPKLKMDDVLALDFSDVQGDYAGALPFIETDAVEPPKAAKKRREA